MDGCVDLGGRDPLVAVYLTRKKSAGLKMRALWGVDGRQVGRCQSWQMFRPLGQGTGGRAHQARRCPADCEEMWALNDCKRNYQHRFARLRRLPIRLLRHQAG